MNPHNFCFIVELIYKLVMIDIHIMYRDTVEQEIFTIGKFREIAASGGSRQENGFLNCTGSQL